MPRKTGSDANFVHTVNPVDLLAKAHEHERFLAEVARILGVPPHRVLGAVRKAIARDEELRREIDRLRRKLR